MSISKTSKLLNYINYREPRAPLRSSVSVLSTPLTAQAAAGMRVTVLDGRQMVGRRAPALGLQCQGPDHEQCSLLGPAAGSWPLIAT